MIKKEFNLFYFVLIFILTGLLNVCQGQTNPTAQTLPYTQNFGTATFTSMPAGMAAWTSGALRATQSAAETAVPAADATVTAATASQTGGNVYGYAASSNARAYIQQSSNATNGTNTIALAINTGTATAITVAYQLELINGGATTQDFGIALQYRLGTTGSFTTISGSALTFGAVTTYTPTTLSYNLTGLTASSVYQIRWITWRPSGSSSSKGVGIDNISITTYTAPVPSIALSSPSQIAAGNLLQGSVNQPISNFQAAVTTTNATLNTLAFVTGNGGGTYASSDITDFKLYYNATSNTYSSATQIGTTQVGVASGSTVTFSSLATTINSGSTGYFWITSSIASGATAGNKLNVNASPTLTFASGTLTGSISAGGNQTISAAVPTIAIANGTISSGNIIQNTTNNILYRADVTVGTTAATLNSASFTTAGTYSSTDLTNLKLWYQTSTTFNSGTATLLATKTTALGAGVQTFSSLTQSFLIGTGYLFVTCDVPCSAVSANTINVQAISSGSLTFASGTPTGSSFTAGGSQTIINASPVNVTAGAATATGNSGEVSLSWTNPTGCFSEVMIVAAPAPNTGTPSGNGSAYTANLIYSSGTALGNGFVVYKGSTSPQLITGLTNGATYSFKLFTRNGTTWSAGSEVSATPNATLYINTFTGASACPTNGNTPTVSANATGVALSRNTITCNATSNVFNSTTLNATTAINNNSYIEFSVTANSGYELNINSLSFFRQASNSAPNQLEVRYSTDGFATSTSWGSAPLTSAAGTVATWDFVDFSSAISGTVTFRIYPYGTQRADLTAGASSAGTFRLDDVTIYGTSTLNTTPIITVGALSPAGSFSALTGTPSSAKTFALSGFNLLSNLTVSAVSGYEYSDDGFATAGQSSLTYSTASVSKTISVRLTGVAVGTYNGTANIVSTGATNSPSTISLNGTVSDPVPIISVGTLSPGGAFSANTGAPSLAQTFTLTGSYLTANLTVSAVSGYEYSDDGFATSGQSSLTYSTASVSKTISVRLTGVAAGTYTGTITIASTGATGSPATISVTGTVTTQPTITEVLLPQYMQGVNGTNSNRIPYACLLTLTNLNANATYNYFTGLVLSTDLITANGAGNCIFPASGSFVRSSGGSLSSAGNFGSFTANASGSYTGWFVVEPTGNSRFTPGNNVFIRLNMNDGASGTTIVYQPTTTNSAKIINLVAAAGANNGTGLRGNSSAIDKNFVFVYDNVAGTGRPLSGTFVESDGTANTTINSYASFYGTSVEAVSGAYGLVIPNTNANGIKRIEQRDFTTGNIAGCPFIDSDGVWPSGANTVNPVGGTTAIVITSSDAPLSASVGGSVSSSATVCSGSNSGTLSLSGQTGAIVKWQYSIDNFASDIHDIANVTTSQSYLNLIATTSYRAVVQSGVCTSVNSSVATITVSPLPIVTTANTASICSGTATAISLTASGPSTFAWTVGTITGSITGASAGTGASIAQTLTNPGSSAAGTVQYIVTPTATSGGCAGSPYTITVTVNPLPAITCPSTITVAAAASSCSSVVTYTATSTTPGAVITYSIVSGSTFNVGTTSVTATATTAAGCVSTCTFDVIVTSSGYSNWLGSASTDWFDSNNWCGGVPTATTDVVIASGTTFSPEISTTGAACKNININSGATLTMNGLGYLTVSGNWVKAGTFTATAGSVNFAGATAQTVTGATTFFDFELNNAAGLTLGGSASSIVINGDAQLNTGIITTGTVNVVTVSASGYLSVTSGYVNGFLTKTIAVGTGVSETFEVGNATTYTPITYNFNNVTTAGTLKVNTVATDHPNISTSGLDNTKTINRYWNMVKTGLVFDYYDLDVNYVTADMDAGFVQTYAGAKIRVSSTWSANSYAATYAAANYVSFTGLTVMGALQIGVFNPVPLAYTVTPDYGYLGTTSNLVVSGNGFLSGVSSVNAMSDVTINSTTVNSDTTLTLNITVSPTATVGSRSFAITNASPFGGVSDSLTISIRPAPVASFYANRTTIGCEVTGTVEYMNYTTDAVSYLWDFGAGASPATATGFGPYTVSYATTGLKTVQLIAFSPLGNDTVLRTNYVNVTHLAPSIPASITGPTSVCSSGPNKIYSVPLVAGITNYVWTVPTGATIVSGAGTRTITVSFAPSYATGTLTVKQENGCGESPTKSLVINGLPPAPASISGPTNICSLVSATYTVSAVVGATSYAWTLPTGVTTASGASTAATTGTTLTVYFAPGAGGYISVSSVNVCSSSPSILLLVTGTSTLVTPAALTGPTSSCGLTTGTYTVSAVAGATGYEWTFPAGVTSALGASPVITTGTSITLTYGAVASGTISVAARNTCATSGSKTIAFTNAVAAPASVSGPTNICGISTGTYTVSAVTGATGYVWTLSSGVTSGGLSTVTTSGTTLTVDYSVGTSSGTIAVGAANACVTSADATVAFTSSGATPPATPGVISGPTAVCNLANATYSFTAVSGATSYTWTLPTGVVGGPSSTVITTVPSLYVSFSGFTAGSISVTANNCSSSAARTLALTTVPATPASITGATVICASASQTYTVATVAGATDYIWTLPAGVTYGGLSGAVSIPAAISGANTITVDIDPSFTSGTLAVKAENTCGTSANRSISLSSIPLTPGAITGPVVACGLTTATYSIAAVSGATSYTWTLPAGFTLASGSTGTGNSITVDIASFTSGTLSVVANGACGSSIAKTLAISNTIATPTNLVGSTFVCGLSSATYTASAVSGATGYTWTLPAGVSSAGVYTSVTTTGNSLPVAFDAGFTSGILSVVSNSASCGSSLPKTITISRAPLTPATLSGSTNICNLSSATYTVSATTNAVSYTWTLPAGVTSGGLSTVTIPAVSSGSNTITVNFAAQSISGSIAVTANSACGSSAPKTLTFTGTTAPGTPTAISGSTVVCANSSGTYTATAVVGAISYTWTLPAGVTSGGVASSVTTSSNSIALDFGSTFVSGSISVKANNHCTTSAVARTLALTTVIGTAGIVTGPTVVCGLTSATYTVAATVGAVSYTWTLPAGVTAAAGASPVTIVGSNTITVDFGTFTTATLSVKANSACATSATARTLAISKLAATPGLISGPTNVCGVTTATYSVVAVAGATGYKWTVPADLTIVSGQGTNTINVSIATGPGSTVSTSILSVRDTNECGQSAARSLTLSNCHSYTAFSADNDNGDVSTVESSLYPNPSAGNFNVQYNSEINSELIIEMYDVLGKLVFSELETIVEGENIFRYNQGDLQKGSYFIRLTDEKNNMKETKILIVQ